MRKWTAVLLLSLASCASGESAPASLERKIAREPNYLAKPLYGLILFDPSGDSSVWFVLDKSSPDLKEHDILYVDRNGNGDLTEPGERSVSKVNEGGTLNHEIGSIQVAGRTHTDFRLHASMAQRGVAPFFRIKVDGKVEMWGGFNRLDEDTTLGTTPETAPVFFATLQGPLTFHLFVPTYEFTRGDRRRVALVVGTPGRGPATFMAVHENYLEPGKDRLFGTWIAKDREGRELRERFEIKSHC